MVPALQKTAWWFLKKLKIERPWDPEIPLVGVCPEDLEAASQRETVTSMLVAALFPVAEPWKQPVSTNE